jgi:hypothetical protein
MEGEAVMADMVAVVVMEEMGELFTSILPKTQWNINR